MDRLANPRSPLFDAYLIVDWSANSKPKSGKDSIWYFLLRRGRGGEQVVGPSNPPTRHLALEALRPLLEAQVASCERTLLGFDFAYGYPQGMAAGLSLGDPPWRAVWDRLKGRIRDKDNNGNNRFEVASEINRQLGERPGPFWACPSSKQTRYLTSRKPNPWNERFPGFRLTDSWQSRANSPTKDATRPKPQSPWKLYGAGAVGSQALLGIPRLAQLRDNPRFSALSRVWPFETGLRAPDFNGYCLVHAEVYPSLVPFCPNPGKKKDALQVEALARHFAKADDTGELARYFGGPPELTLGERRQVEAEEGWILGVL